MALRFDFTGIKADREAVEAPFKISLTGCRICHQVSFDILTTRMRHRPINIQFCWFFLCLHFYVQQASSAVSEEDLFPFGINAGDSTMPPSVGSAAGPIPLQQPFPFFNGTEKNLFMNSNGAISFRGAAPDGPFCGPDPRRLGMVVPYWAHVDTTQGLGGSIFYRESIEPSLRAKAAIEIQRAFPDAWDVEVAQLFIATWYKVSFEGASGCRHTNDSAPRNTFQLTLASDGVHSYAIMYYTNITWTACTGWGGANCSGLAARNPAKAGFDFGDGKTFYEIPGSCTNALANITETTNTGFPGKWIFRIDNTISAPSCDSDLYKTRKLEISPSFATLFGQIPIAITGPCFNNSYTASCIFHDGANRVQTPATIQAQGGIWEAVCIVPYMYSLGRANVELNLQFGDIAENYTGYIYVTEMEEDLKVAVSPLPDQKLLLNLTWDSKFFPETAALELVLLEYDVDKKNWKELGVFGEDINNTGAHKLVASNQDISTFAVFSLRMRSIQRAKRDIPFGKNIWRISIPSAVTYALYQGYRVVSGTACQEWYEKEPRMPNDPDILHCPPTLDLASQDYRFTQAQEDILLWGFERVTKLFGEDLRYYAQRTPTSNGASQLCSYKNGKLFMKPPFAGHVIKSTISFTNFFDWVSNEVLPHDVYCCYGPAIGNNFQITDDCQKFYDKRPSDPGTEYVRPRPARAQGDPHIATFDGASYTFNGAGEFWMIKNTNRGDFEMQARMEQFVQPSGKTTLATVFTAFVMRESGTSVQVQLSLSNKIDILLNGESINFGSDQNERLVPTEKATIVSSGDRKEVNVSFSSGFSFCFTSVENSLMLWSTADAANKGKTRGLLGVFDGHPENDLETPSGTVVPLSSSLETIHFDFGLKWMIAKEESYFAYGRNKSYETYKNEQFRPSFVMPDPQKMDPRIVEMCDQEFECLYDYATTSSIVMANQSGAAVRKYNQTIDLFSTEIPMCPSIKAPANGYINATNFFVNETVDFGCYSGFQLHGNAKVECTGEKKWSGEPPTCNNCRKFRPVGILLIFLAIMALFLKDN